MKTTAQKRFSGFTLIELLIVIGILAILLAITLVALNPARQFAQANNTKRRNDVNVILNAIHQFSADNNGTIPTGIDSTVRTIESAAGATSVNICAEIVPLYVAQLPVDPQVNNGVPVDAANCDGSVSAWTTGYTVVTIAANNRVTVAAAAPELSEVISVTR